MKVMSPIYYVVVQSGKTGKFSRLAPMVTNLSEAERIMDSVERRLSSSRDVLMVLKLVAVRNF